MAAIILLSLVVLAVGAYCVWGLVLFFMQPRLTFCPTKQLPCTPHDVMLDFEQVYFASCDGVQLHGWYIPSSPGHFTVLFCHGNAGNIAHRIETLRFFHRLGLNCFIFDYRGYGNSQGSPTEIGTYRDVQAAYQWLTHNKPIPPRRIILFGRSLGGSIAAWLAARVPLGGLVLEGTFTCYVDMGRRLYPYMPVRWFARYRYDTLASLKQVRCPVLIMHSRDDELVPLEFGRRLYEATRAPKRFVEILGGHNGTLVESGERYRKAWTDWLQSLQSPTEAVSSQPD